MTYAPSAAEELDDSGWAHLSAVGSYIQRIRADFDARLFRKPPK